MIAPDDRPPHPLPWSVDHALGLIRDAENQPVAPVDRRADRVLIVDTLNLYGKTR